MVNIPMRRHLPLIFLVLALGLTGLPARADVAVGTAGPFTGPNGQLGQQIRRGVALAIEDINASGGLNGERLAMTDLDDACDPKKAVEVATRLVSSGVKLVAGHYCSGASIPASKIYEQAGIVQISPASSHPKFTDEGGWNVFRICPRDDAQGSAAARMIVEKFPAAKVAILNDQSPASLALTAKLRDALVAANAPPILDEGYKPGAKDYGELVQRLRDSGATLVYFGGGYVESAIIAGDLRGMGSTAQYLGGDQLLNEDYWKGAGDAAEGTLVTFMFDPQKFEEAKPLIARFREEGAAPEGFTLYAYAAVEAWKQAAIATGSTEGRTVAAWLRAGNRVRTAVGEVRFDTKGDLQDPRFSWFRWSDGRYFEIDPATLQPPEISTTP